MIPLRSDPRSGALVATFVLGGLLAPPLLIVGLIIWMVSRASRRSSSRAKPDVDPELAARFHELEEGILDANAADPQGSKKLATKRTAGSRRRGRPTGDQ